MHSLHCMNQVWTDSFKDPKLIQSGAVSDFSLSFIVYFTLMTVAGKLGCCPFKTDCMNPIYWSTSGFHPTVYIYVTHNRLCLHGYTMCILTSVCTFNHSSAIRCKRDLNSHCMLSERAAFCVHTLAVCQCMSTSLCSFTLFIALK